MTTFFFHIKGLLEAKGRGGKHFTFSATRAPHLHYTLHDASFHTANITLQSIKLDEKNHGE